MKRTIMIFLTLMIVVSASLESFAAVGASNESVKKETENHIDVSKIDVYTDEFPSAYIEKDVVDLQDSKIRIANGKLVSEDRRIETERAISNINSNKEELLSVKKELNEGNELIAVVDATAYVKESYKEEKGDIICESSELLTKAELINNRSMAKAASPIDSESDSLYALSIGLKLYKCSKAPQRYKLVGTAQWKEGDPHLSGHPAAGKDYIGLTWGGYFDYSGESCTVTSNNSKVGLGGSKKAAATPNKAIVWKFNEYKYHVNYGNIYAKNVTAKSTLNKKTLTGKGNTTGAVLKYIHTYASADGSISIGGGAGGVAGNITLTGCKKQWSLVVDVHKMKY